MAYFEYLLQSFSTKNKINNIFAMSGKGVSRLLLPKNTRIRSLKRSLRSIVKGLDEEYNAANNVNDFKQLPINLLNKGL